MTAKEIESAADDWQKLNGSKKPWIHQLMNAVEAFRIDTESACKRLDCHECPLHKAEEEHEMCDVLKMRNIAERIEKNGD